MISREKPLDVGQRVLIQPNRKRHITPPLTRGTIESLAFEKSPRTNQWVYYVRMEDGVLNTYSDPQLTLLTVLDEIVLA
jgi:hypothetical protein